MPKLSIILAFYNEEKYLKRAVDSVLNQPFTDFELICIDDGSTDRSRDIIENYGNRVRLINSQHKGVAAARNQGMAAAKGDFITYLDADDYYTGDALNCQFKVYEENGAPALSIVLGKSRVHFESDELRKEYYFNIDNADETTSSFLGAALVPLAVVRTIGNFNESLVTGSDYDWFMRLSDHGVKIILSASVILVVTRHQHNMTKDFAKLKRSHLSLFRARIKAKKS